MDMYKLAVLSKLTIPTNKGILNVIEASTLSLKDLSLSLTTLNKTVRDDKDGLDFLDDSKVVNKTLELQFNILKDLYLTKKEEMNKVKEARDAKEHNDKILSLIAEKQENSLKDKSIEELKALLK